MRNTKVATYFRYDVQKKEAFMKKKLVCLMAMCCMSMFFVACACGSDMENENQTSPTPTTTQQPNDVTGTVTPEQDMNGGNNDTTQDGAGSIGGNDGIINDIGDGVNDVIDGVGDGVNDVMDGVGNAVDDVTGGNAGNGANGNMTGGNAAGGAR